MPEANPHWAEMADALLRVWNGMGWQALAGFGLFVLIWKYLDSWAKKPRADKP